MLRIRTWIAAVVMVVVATVVLTGAALAAPNGKAVGHSKEGGTPSASGGKSAKSTKSAQPTKGKGGTGVTEDDDDDGVANTPDPHGDADNRHPSGKDKHAEAGGSGNQGNAASEPDGNGKGPERDEGGPDKPGGPGGLDVLDQDGNNGCGNDDDFEDDNEGLCLGLGRGNELPAGRSVPSETEVTLEQAGAPGQSVGAADLEGVGDSAEVLGARLENESAGPLPAVAGAGVAAPAVAGVPLAFTGANVLALLAVASSVATIGIGLLVAGRRRARGA